MTYFIRTENGVEVNVSKEAGLAEANRCMMDGKREVEAMTAVPGMYFITYKDGRNVYLSRQDGDMPAPAEEKAQEPSAHVVSFNGGKVHTAMPGLDDEEADAYPLCRGGGQNQMLTKFRPTTAPLSCKTCMTYAERRAARLAREDN